MKNFKVTKEVDINEFGTDVVLAELFNRLGDHLHDPEPKYDPFLESMDRRDMKELMDSLKRVIPGSWNILG